MEIARVDPSYSSLDSSSLDSFGLGTANVTSSYLFGEAAASPMDATEGWSTMAGLTNTSVVDTNGTANNTFDVEKLLATYLGPRHRSLLEWVILTIVYCAIFLTGVVGNVSTCIVIAKNSYMHTATNYYLFSLAISDVLTLILGLPPELYTIWEAYPWVFGEPFCVFKIFLSEMTSSASVLTITAFTVERYVAICHPIWAQTMSSLSRAVKSIFGIWILACATAMPYAIHARTFYYVKDPYTGESLPDSLQCNILPEWLPTMTYMFQLSTFILFIAPMTIISVLYILIGLTLRQSSVARRTSSNCTAPSSGSSQSRRAVLKMLVAVVVAFFICWAPFHAQRLMTALIKEHQWTSTLIEFQTVLFYISGVFYFVSSTVNPILYNLMSRKYRKAFKDTLCRCCTSADTRRKMLEARTRMFSDRLSNTYVTVAGGTNSNRLLVEKGAPSRPTNRAPPTRHHAQTTDSSDTDSDRNATQKTTAGNKKWGSWKTRLLKGRNRRGPPKEGGVRQGRRAVVNGSVYSDTSRSCSPSMSPHSGRGADRDEVELTDVPSTDEVPVHQVILLNERRGSGTYL